jgi:hypothetical protein
VVHEPRLLMDEFAPGENGEVGNALHVIAGGEFRVALRIDFEDDGLSCHFRSRSGDVRGGHSTGAAPFGPEVHQYRDCCVLNDVIEERSVCTDGLVRGRQGLFACAATTGVGKMRGGYAVFCCTTLALPDYRHDGAIITKVPAALANGRRRRYAK